MSGAAEGGDGNATGDAGTDGTDGGRDRGTRRGSAGGGAALETESLTKRFGELVAVDDLNLSVERGEVRSVIGPNGAGKTTLFDLITGVRPPSAGRVRLDGEDVTDLPPHRRVRRGLGRSFQITNVFPGLSVRENVGLAARARVTRGGVGDPGTVTDATTALRADGGSALRRAVDWFVRPSGTFAAANDAAESVLDRIGLADRADERAGALAYGDRRRLEIGLVLATDPQVVLLDEPTAGMSAEETRATMDLIGEVLADRTLVLVEHDVDLVMGVSDRVTVLDRGRELATGTPAEIAEDPRVREAYLGGEDV